VSPSPHGYDEHGGICTESATRSTPRPTNNACYRFDAVINNFCGGDVSGVQDISEHELDDVASACRPSSTQSASTTSEPTKRAINSKFVILSEVAQYFVSNGVEGPAVASELSFYPTTNSSTLASTPSSTVANPTVTGRENRRGPALPD